MHARPDRLQRGDILQHGCVRGPQSLRGMHELVAGARVRARVQGSDTQPNGLDVRRLLRSVCEDPGMRAVAAQPHRFRELRSQKPRLGSQARVRGAVHEWERARARLISQMTQLITHSPLSILAIVSLSLLS